MIAARVIGWLEAWVARLRSPERRRLSLRVPGVPRPKGSLTFLGRGRVKENTKGAKAWVDRVRLVAQATRLEPFPRERPVSASLVFYLPRPPSHLSKRGEPNRDATTYPVREQTGDVDKLVRAVFDALKGSAYGDDAQVVELYARKLWALPGEPEGVCVTIEEVD